jgi:hypothetical protein
MFCALFSVEVRLGVVDTCEFIVVELSRTKVLQLANFVSSAPTFLSKSPTIESALRRDWLDEFECDEIEGVGEDKVLDGDFWPFEQGVSRVSDFRES